MIVFIAFSTYFWYKFFLDLGSDGKLVNGANASIYMTEENNVHTIYSEDMDKVEGYKFNVQNRGISSANYNLLIKELSPEEVKDGCNSSKIIDNNKLNFELYNNGVKVNSGVLGRLQNNVLDSRAIMIDETNRYELCVWLNSDADDLEGMHYHYKVELEVIK